VVKTFQVKCYNKTPKIKQSMQ